MATRSIFITATRRSRLPDGRLSVNRDAGHDQGHAGHLYPGRHLGEDDHADDRCRGRQ